jgi:hypothetical protein
MSTPDVYTGGGRTELRPHKLCKRRNKLRGGVDMEGHTFGVDNLADGEPEG